MFSRSHLQRCRNEWTEKNGIILDLREELEDIETAQARWMDMFVYPSK
jgi:hypothetical protein